MAYNGYHELNELPPAAFLDWQSFDTPYDRLEINVARDLAGQQYAKGLEVGSRSEHVSIGCNGTWSALGKDGSLTSSYEGIGYHACTKDLLRGFLDSGTPIFVYRRTTCEEDRTRIK